MPTKANHAHQEMKHNFVIDRLRELGFTESQTGKSLYDLSYEEAKYELVIWEFKNIDAEHSSQKWF